MHLLILFVTLAHAAVPAICAEDLSAYPLAVHVGPLQAPKHLVSRALRPGLMKMQEDMCRCLAKFCRNRPSLVKAYLHVDPNGGKTRVEYIVQPPESPPIGRMLECMGEPMLTFEPIHLRERHEHRRWPGGGGLPLPPEGGAGG